jgi:hypothetical protein
LIGGPYIETDETVIKVFRPKSAIKKVWNWLVCANKQKVHHVDLFCISHFQASTAAKG